MASWKFVLCRSSNQSEIGELTQASSRQIVLTHNRPGSASFIIPIDDELGEIINPIEYSIKAYRRGTVGTRLIWSGYVNAIDENVSDNRMSVNCIGWLNRLNNRILRVEKDYVNIDDGDIILELLQEANGNPTSRNNYEWNSGTYQFTTSDSVVLTWPNTTETPNTPTFIKRTNTSKIPNEGIGGSTPYVDSLRSIRYAKYQTNIGQAIQQLTEIENGCDIWVEPSTRILYVYRKRNKIIDNIVFGFQSGPENIAHYNRQLDGSTTVNYFLATGGTATTPQYQVDRSSMDLYGPVEEVSSLSDVTGTSANSILQYYAAAEVAIRAQPRELHSITPFAFTEGGSVPEPFVDYDLGDQVIFTARHGSRINVNQQVRVFGMSISIDEEDNERLGQLQIYPQ